MDTGIVRRRQAVIQVQGVRLWWGFTPFRYVISGVVDLCPGCATNQDEDAKIGRQKRLMLIGSTGVGLFSWIYLGTTGLIGAVIVILAGAFYRWRVPKVYLPQKMKDAI